MKLYAVSMVKWHLKPLFSRFYMNACGLPGCGTSDVAAGLLRDGFRHIVNIDFSEVVVKLMAGRCAMPGGGCKQIMTDTNVINHIYAYIFHLYISRPPAGFLPPHGRVKIMPCMS